jgi:hypothetical protein
MRRSAAAIITTVFGLAVLGGGVGLSLAPGGGSLKAFAISMSASLGTTLGLAAFLVWLQGRLSNRIDVAERRADQLADGVYSRLERIERYVHEYVTRDVDEQLSQHASIAADNQRGTDSDASSKRSRKAAREGQEASALGDSTILLDGSADTRTASSTPPPISTPRAYTALSSSAARSSPVKRAKKYTVEPPDVSEEPAPASPTNRVPVEDVERAQKAMVESEKALGREWTKDQESKILDAVSKGPSRTSLSELISLMGRGLLWIGVEAQILAALRAVDVGDRSPCLAVWIVQLGAAKDGRLVPTQIIVGIVAEGREGGCALHTRSEQTVRYRWRERVHAPTGSRDELWLAVVDRIATFARSPWASRFAGYPRLATLLPEPWVELPSGRLETGVGDWRVDHEADRPPAELLTSFRAAQQLLAARDMYKDQAFSALEGCVADAIGAARKSLLSAEALTTPGGLRRGALTLSRLYGKGNDERSTWLVGVIDGRILELQLSVLLAQKPHYGERVQRFDMPAGFLWSVTLLASAQSERPRYPDVERLPRVAWVERVTSGDWTSVETHQLYASGFRNPRHVRKLAIQRVRSMTEAAPAIFEHDALSSESWLVGPGFWVTDRQIISTDGNYKIDFDLIERSPVRPKWLSAESWDLAVAAVALARDRRFGNYYLPWDLDTAAYEWLARR